jgi:hypothetical protein
MALAAAGEKKRTANHALGEKETGQQDKQDK